MATSITRNPVFDVMKGIGIILMLIGHIAGIPGWLRTFIFSFHMPLFFILAGYFCKVPEDGAALNSQIKKDVKRLLLPFVFTQILLILWTILQYILKDNPNMLIRAVLSMLYGGNYMNMTKWGGIEVDALWFLPALFMTKTAFNILLSRRLSKPVLFASCLLLSIAATVANKYIQVPWNILQGLSVLVFVVLGYLVHYPPRINQIWIIIISLCCWILAVRFSGIDLNYCYYSCYPLDVIGACGGTYAVYLISKLICKCRFVAWPLVWCGTYSLVILCFHALERTSGFAYSLVIHSPFSLSGCGMIVFRYLLVIVITAIVIHIPRIKEIYGVRPSHI